ncbi:MAG: FAD-binding oxidoreductase [Vicinamibacteraceae bacterium]|nr:FAD-binding oxidoreductase [Vicinamibacteraceae bacterium]
MSSAADPTLTSRLRGFTGTLIWPDSDGYDDARRIFNGMFDRRPSVIARCTSAGDVVRVVRAVRERQLDVTVFGGGHGVTGAAVADGAVCIDLRGMKRIDVDAKHRTARAEAGLTWGEFDAATQAHGLAVTGGRVTSTGIAGLTLGSGSGWLERKFGLSCDSLIGAEVVTADGREVFASSQEHADLFWGLRGGGGNFGVVTAFHFRLHTVGPVLLAGMLLYPAGQARDVVRAWRDFMAAAPDEVGGGLAFVTAPPAPFVPEALRGQPVVAVIACYVGPVAQGEAALRPLREWGTPAAADLLQPMPYVALQRLLDEGNPKGMQNYWTADFLSGLPDEAVDTLVAHATRPVSALSQVVLIPGGGALARVGDNDTAFGQRQCPWNVHYLSIWPDPADSPRQIAHTRTMAQAMKPWSAGHVYLNYIGDEGTERVVAAFTPEKFRRLQALKDKWDPANLFRHNQNIPPSRRT